VKGGSVMMLGDSNPSGKVVGSGFCWCTDHLHPAEKLPGPNRKGSSSNQHFSGAMLNMLNFRDVISLHFGFAQQKGFIEPWKNQHLDHNITAGILIVADRC